MRKYIQVATVISLITVSSLATASVNAQPRKAPQISQSVRSAIATARNCTELRQKGIQDISVRVYPEARKFDRDRDGIACESSKR
ncbi:MAG: excalibur calcium-binding domain-containing protein [Scytonematopsis contorta HA4267-MV1]|jgi:hypothetical protein|nr:excalibur calcium-binding domain-containing protein [Scytonematopsis contorta HA4267-MV1]